MNLTGPQGKRYHEPVVTSFALGVTTTASVRSNLACHHLRSAAYFARQAGTIEKVHDKLEDSFFFQHRAYCTGAILAAVAALEAATNELLLDAVENSKRLSHMDAKVRAALAAKWPKIERNSILSKYQFILRIATGKVMDKGAEPYHAADCLVTLRNALVHFKPEWDTNLDHHAKIEDQLRGRFPECPWFDSGNAFFPKRCLGYGCARWSTETALALATEFSTRLSLDPILGSTGDPQLSTTP